MRKFTFDDPDGNGQNDTYGLSCAGYNYLSFLMGAFGASTERDNFLNDDGTITTNAISNEYKDALKYLNSIYKEGLIDPEMGSPAPMSRLRRSGAAAKWAFGPLGGLTPVTLTPVLTSAIFSRTRSWMRFSRR